MGRPKVAVDIDCFVPYGQLAKLFLPIQCNYVDLSLAILAVILMAIPQLSL